MEEDKSVMTKNTNNKALLKLHNQIQQKSGCILDGLLQSRYNDNKGQDCEKCRIR